MNRNYCNFYIFLLLNFLILNIVKTQSLCEKLIEESTDESKLIDDINRNMSTIKSETK